MSPHVFAALAVTELEGTTWELTKGIMQAVTTAAVLTIVKILWDLRERFTRLEHIVVGPDGDNGLRSLVRRHEEEIEAIQKRNDRIDAEVEVERRHDPDTGPDRRRIQRRFADREPDHHTEETDR